LEKFLSRSSSNALLFDQIRTTDNRPRSLVRRRFHVADPNLRPKLWTSKEEMTGAMMQAATVSSISLPSHEDEAEWFSDADSAATATRYAKAGARTVLVKNGPAEILIHDANTFATISPERIETVVDRTAAGDSFNAGHLAAILQGASETDAAVAGAALAGKVIRSRGALVTQAI
jgi:2-dehydro-3-deoxygluconokinase